MRLQINGRSLVTKAFKNVKMLNGMKRQEASLSMITKFDSFLLKNRKTFKGDVMLIGASFNIKIFIILGRRDMALKLHNK